MKCIIEQGSTCRRCRRGGLPCVFVPRANAAGVWRPSLNPRTVSESLAGDLGVYLLQRVKAIEDHLGLSSTSDGQEVTNGSLDVDDGEPAEEDPRMEPLWRAAAPLERATVGLTGSHLWRRSKVKHLFQTFHQKMPGLHFLPDKQRYSSPHPLLLAAILYCSSMRGDQDVAELAPEYFTVLCTAISQLSIPGSEIGSAPTDPTCIEEWAFQTVLGLVLAGLLAEASIRETGIWISIAYRFILEHCPPHSQERDHDWRRLFNGVQIVDLEHASLHLASPVIPIEPPLTSLQTSHRDQLYRLSRMMHTGLVHFAGRGLPTIWSYLANDLVNQPNIQATPPFTAVDAAVMRDWARQLDDWLEEFTRASVDTQEDRRLVFRQYVLHRLVVLSIYHPARGCDLHSSSITPKEQHELLLSARAAVKLHLDDKTIWSNWDIVMITWAALIVMQGIECGAGEPDDLNCVRAHLLSLRETNEPGLSLRARLAARLERALEGVHTPDFSALQQQNTLNIDNLSPNFDPSWEIFNQASLQQVMFPIWTNPTELQDIQLNASTISTQAQVHPGDQWQT